MKLSKRDLELLALALHWWQPDEADPNWRAEAKEVEALLNGLRASS